MRGGADKKRSLRSPKETRASPDANRCCLSRISRQLTRECRPVAESGRLSALHGGLLFTAAEVDELVAYIREGGAKLNPEELKAVWQ